jgi:alpha-tubulin suppressor-like RCC1 family protein
MIPFGLIYLIGCESDKGVVVYNTPPTADIISHDNGSEVFEGYPVEFRAALSDVNHDTDQLTARWKVNGEEVCPFLPPDQAGESVCVATINEGDEEVMVEVRDPENASGGEAINLSIVPTEAPTADIISPEESGVFYSDYIITFEGKISDEEDDVEELIFNWKSNLDGDLSFDTEVETDGTVLGFGYLTEGQHAITLRVEDTTGKSTSANTTINVGGPNSNPTCEIVAPDSGFAVPVGDLISFEGNATDEDINNNQLTVDWTSDKIEGSLGSSTPNTNGEFTFSYSDLTVDTHSITMTVTDEKGASCSDYVIVTIGTPPSVTIDSPTSGTYNEGETITFSATVSDNEDQSNEISLEWTTSDGTVLNSQSATSDGTIEFVLNDMTYGQQVVTLTGTDTDGLTASDLVSFTINALPTQPSLTVLPENPKTGDDITATATGSTDADGGNVTYTYEWVYGSTTVNGSTLSSSETAKGQEWTVTVTPNDGTADGPSVSQTVIIGNTAPTDLVVAITPNSSVYNDSELTCSATANDVDASDTLEYSYEWSTGETTDAITLDNSLNPTDEVTCIATATDGTDSISDSTSVTLENREPVLSNLVIEADEGLWNGTTLTCSADVSDADGETLEIAYSWTLADGTTTVEGSELTLENVSDGDVFTCTASIEDGYQGIDTLSDSVTTTNTLPVVDTISVTPDSVNVGEHTFTCEVETSDADGDDVEVTYEWTINGTPQQEEDTNMFSGSFTLGMVIACNATPNDGKEDGNVVSDDVTIENAKPVVDSVTLSPDMVYTNDIITATAVLSDGDASQSGDLTASYSWHVVDVDGNDVEVQSGMDNTLSGVSYFERDEEVYVVVTANDGVEEGNSATSDSLTVSNTPPTSPSTSLSVTESTRMMEIGKSFGCYLLNGEIGCWGEDVDGQLEAPNGSFTTISVGHTHSCAIDDNQDVHCWGVDTEGVVSGLPTSGSYVDISSGVGHSCAIDTSGSVTCWGVSGGSQGWDFGQVDNTPTSGNYLSVSAGGFNTCAIRSDQSIECWGDDRKDQISSMPSGNNYTKVDVLNDHVCALRDDETITCWGINDSNAAVNHGQVTQMPSSGSFIDISAGSHHSCAIQSNGTAVCWGEDIYGQSSPPATSFQTVDTENYHSCGLTEDGQIECWGLNDVGQSTPPTLSASQTSNDGLICIVDTESTDDDGDEISYTYEWFLDETLMQTASETLELSDTYTEPDAGDWTCEVTAYDGTEQGESTAISTEVSNEVLWLDVDSEGVEDAWICAINSNNKIECWSDTSENVATNYPTGDFVALSLTESTNNSFPVGCGITTNSGIECWPSIPSDWSIPVPTDSGYESIDCGLHHCCALKDNGSISCWGSNSGYSGQGQTTNYPQGTGYQQVACGVYDACALDASGYVSCWGKGGQDAHNTPIGSGHIAVAAGYYGGCALDSTGTPTCWGRNAGNEPNESGFEKLFGHRLIYCGLKLDGSITCWERSDDDDLPQNGYEPNPPTEQFSNIGVGLYQVCGIPKNGGDLMCWGDLPSSFPY